MKNRQIIIKGIHPGLILERELKRQKLKKVVFARAIGEHPQTLVAIIKGRRRMNTALALKAEKALGFDEGYLMILQLYFDIKIEKEKQEKHHPDLGKLRKILFWDTDRDKIDWDRQKKAVIQRVLQRGNKIEVKEIKRFYGTEVIDEFMI